MEVIAATRSRACSAARQRRQPNDAQVAHIAYTAGQIDIDAAQSLQKSKNKEVRAFAEDMLRDHKAVNERRSPRPKPT